MFLRPLPHFPQAAGVTRTLAVAALAAIGALLAGCIPGSADGAGTSAATVTVTVGGSSVRAMIAGTPTEQQVGLGGLREQPARAAATGVLLDYRTLLPRAVRLAGTRAPARVIWLRRGVVTGVVVASPCPERGSDCAAHLSPGLVDGVVEVPVSALGSVRTGDRVHLRA